MRRFFYLLVVFLFFLPSVSSAGMVGYKKARLATVSGQFLMENGKPLPGGFLSFFDATNGIQPSLSGSFRVPQRLGKVDKDGKFNIKILPGSYYMGAMITKDPGRGPGPPKKEEPFFFAKNEDGSFRVFVIKSHEERDFGQIQSGLPDSFVSKVKLGTIEGMLFDENGKPYENAFAMLKIYKSVLAKWDRPDFVSVRTGKDGRYIVHAPAGKYYVIARETIIGGRPRSGDSVGVYGRETSLLDLAADKAAENFESVPLGSEKPENEVGPNFQGERIGAIQAGNEAVAVEVKAGETVTGIDITLYAVPDPVGTRKKFQEEAQGGLDEEGLIEPSETLEKKTEAK